MAWNLVQLPNGQARVEASGASESQHLTIRWADGVEAELGRGTTDTDVTYIALHNETGQKVYIHPNAPANGVTASTIKP